MNIKSIRNHRTMSNLKELEKTSNNFDIQERNRKNNLNLQELALRDIIYKTNSVRGGSLHEHMNSIRKLQPDKEFPKLPMQTYLRTSLKSLNDLGRESKVVKQKNYNSFVYSQNDLNEKRLSKDFIHTSKPLVLENHNINTNKLSVTGQMLSSENLSQINHYGTGNQDNLKYLVSKEQYNNNICNLDNKVDTVREKRLIKDIFLHNPETDKYEQNSQRILQYYSEKYWSQGENSGLRVLDDIPNNLSVHRMKLERLKQLNNKNRETSNSSDLKDSHEKSIFYKRVHFDNQTDGLHSESEKDNSNPYQPFHSEIKSTPCSLTNSKSKNIPCDYNSPKSILKNTNQLENKLSNENQRASNRNIADPFNFERFQRLKQNENMVSTTVNARYVICKESQTENILESSPSRTVDKEVNQDQNHFVKETLKITPIIPENQTETSKSRQITSCSTDPIRIQKVYELPINKEQQFHTKSVIESNKKFQMFGNPMQVYNFQNLRDDDYTRAWKINL